jgi:hypothetical protein
LLNPAHKAIVVNLPTSSGKTMIAEYRILQALNEFKERGGWVAYIAPTKSLVNQVFIQLRIDTEGCKVGLLVPFFDSRIMPVKILGSRLGHNLRMTSMPHTSKLLQVSFLFCGKDSTGLVKIAESMPETGEIWTLYSKSITSFADW